MTANWATKIRATVILLCVQPVGAIADSDFNTWENSRDIFSLENNCEPVNLVVEGLDNDAKEIGLTTKRIRVTVESRLRGARIYRENTYPYVYVNVIVVGAAFSIDVDFERMLVRDGAGHLGKWYATTWARSRTGTHGGNAGYILQSVAELIDEFINEYLRVNSFAC